MDANRFDTLARSLSSSPSRRRALRLLAGSVVGTLWGSFGTGDGQLDDPYGIAVHPNCAVFVTDLENPRIPVFQPVA
jgi:hypothetical protein